MFYLPLRRLNIYFNGIWHTEISQLQIPLNLFSPNTHSGYVEIKVEGGSLNSLWCEEGTKREKKMRRKYGPCNNLSYRCQLIKALRSVIRNDTGDVWMQVLVWSWGCLLLCVNGRSCFELTVISWLRPRVSSCCWISRSRLSSPPLVFISCRTFSPGCGSPSHFQATSEPWPWYTTDTAGSHG